MRKGSIAVPVLAMVFAILAAGAVLYFGFINPPQSPAAHTNTTVSGNTNVAVTNTANTNAAVEENTNGTINQNQITNTSNNSNTQVDRTISWKSYTNERYGFTFKYPNEWTLAEVPVSYLGASYDSVQVYNPLDEVGLPQFAVTAFPMKYDQTDPFSNFTLSTNIVQSTATKTDIVIAGIYGKFFKGFPTLTPPNSAFIDHNTVTFKIDQGSDEEWEAILKTFAFTDHNVDIDSTDPIISVSEISNSLGWTNDGGISDVDIMGDNALIGGNQHLSYYNGTKFTDISSKVDKPGVAWGVGHISNNGSYWLISIVYRDNTSSLFRYDGKNMIDLSEALNTAVPRPVSAGSSGTWNGSYWLMTVHAGRVAKYDGQTFTDLTSQVPTINETGSLGVPVWNGSYFLFSGIASGNHGKFYRYDGNNFSVVSGLGSNTYAMSAGWNGSYWLISGFNNQHLLKYNGTTFTDLGFPQHQGSIGTWVTSKWLVGPNWFDGKTLDTTTPFNIGYRVNSVSVGSKYGLMLGENGTVYRFDF